MQYFDSRREILDAVGKWAEQRAASKLTWSPPYDSADLDEILEGFAGLHKRGKAKKRRETNFYKGFPTQDQYTAAIRFSHRMRAELGLSKAIPLDGMKEVFSRKAWLNTGLEARARLPYLVDHYVVGPDTGIKGLEFGLRFCLVDYLDLSGRTPEDDESILALSSVINGVSETMALHPALSLAMILCDVPAYLDWATTVEYSGRITVNMRYPKISPQIVKSMYSIARKAHHDRVNLLEPSTKWPRWRDTSERVSKLVDFVRRSEGTSWLKRWQDWNSTYPNWPYTSINSMRVVYYREASPEKKRRGGKRR